MRPSPGLESMDVVISAPSLLEDRPQVLEFIEEMPQVVLRAVHAVRVQIRQLRVVAITFERRLRVPLDQDQHLAPRPAAPPLIASRNWPSATTRPPCACTSLAERRE